MLRRWHLQLIAAMACLAAAPASAQPVCLEQRATPGDPWPFKSFGSAVAIEGDVAVIGAHTDIENGTNAGAAYAFEFDGASWVQTQKLLAPDSQQHDRFARELALEGDVLAIATRFHQHPDAPARGAVYMWRRAGNKWEFQQKITPPAADISLFANLVDLDGERLVVTASGRVFLYSFDGESWVLFQEIADLPLGTRAVLDGDVLVLAGLADSTFCDDPEGMDSGILYVYRFAGGQWVEEQTLVASQMGCNRSFGQSVAVSGNTIIATARPSSTFPMANAFVFEYDEVSGQWHETAILTPPSGEWSFSFGTRPRSTALLGDVAIIGNDSIDNGPVSSEAYIYQRVAQGQWIQRAILQPLPNQWGSFFGWAVATDGQRAIIGGHGEDQQSGSAYIFDIQPPAGDVTCDGLVNIDDLLLLLSSWGSCPAAGENAPCPADLNGDGVIDVSDLLILLANWG